MAKMPDLVIHLKTCCKCDDHTVVTLIHEPCLCERVYMRRRRGNCVCGEAEGEDQSK